MKPSPLKQKMQTDLGLPETDFDYHATDLYVRWSPAVQEWLQTNYAFNGNVSAFVSQIDNRMWLDIPFAGNWPD